MGVGRVGGMGEEEIKREKQRDRERVKRREKKGRGRQTESCLFRRSACREKGRGRLTSVGKERLEWVELVS